MVLGVSKSTVQPVRSTKPSSMSFEIGKQERSLKVVKNHFKLVKNMYSHLYQYSVNFSPKEDHTEIRKGLLRHHKSLLGFAYMFDGNNLYSLSRLHSDAIELFSTRSMDQEKIKIKIIFRNELDLGDYHFTLLLNILLRNCIDIKTEVKMNTDLRNLMYEIWPTYVTSVFQNNNIIMNIPVSPKVHRYKTALDLLMECKEFYPQDWKKKFEAEIIDTIVYAPCINKLYTIDYVDFESNPTKFVRKDFKSIKLLTFYKNKYNITIQNWEQPILIHRPKKERAFLSSRNENNIYLIPELCELTRTASFQKNKYGVKHEIGFLSNLFQRIGKNTSNNDYANTARMLLATTNLRPKLFEWAIITPATLKGTGIIDNLLSDLKRAATSVNFEMNLPQTIVFAENTPRSYWNAIESCAGRQKLQLVMCIVTNIRYDIICSIKEKCCIDRPVACKIISMKELMAENRLSIATNIVMHINSMLGGARYYDPSAYVNTDKIQDPMMVVGIDVYHNTNMNGRPVGAIIASLDYYYTKFYSAVIQHPFGKRLSNDIAGQIGLAVLRFKDINGRLPSRVLIYRDGVGESDNAFLLDDEIQMIKNRLSTMFPLADFKIAFIVVLKKTNFKLYVDKGKPKPDTVLDDVITRADGYKFYLVAQSVRQGTVAPVSYYVLYDTTGMTHNLMQRITYKMAVMHYNYSATEESFPFKIPAQVIYAHKLAYLVGRILHQSPITDPNGYLYFL